MKTGLMIFLAALAVRLLFLVDISDSPTFDAPIVDEMTYDQMARDLAQTGTLDARYFWQPLFYPLFLTGVYVLTGNSIVAAKIIQAVIAAMACVLVWRVGLRVFNRTSALAAAVLAVLYVPGMFFESQLLATGWAIFWATALILAFLRTEDQPSGRNTFILGLVGGLSIITRPVFVPFLACAVVWLMVRWFRKKIPVRAQTIAVAGLAVGFVLVLTPVAALSYHVLGRVRILPYSRGINLYVGNNPDYRDTINIRPGRGWDTLTREPIRAGYLDPLEGERYFLDKAAHYYRRRPMAFLAGLADKAVQLISSRELPRNVDIYAFRQWSGWLRGGVWKLGGWGFPFGLILPLAILGLWFNRRQISAVIWLYLVFYPAAVVLVFVSSRYRMPWTPMLIILAAGGCQSLLKMIKHRDKKAMLTVGIFMTAAIFISSFPGPFPAEKLDYLPELYYCRADSLTQHGRLDNAVESYQKAIALKKGYAEAHHNLGLLFVRLDRTDEAIAHFQTALRSEPDHVDVYLDWGRALLTKQQFPLAIELFKKACRVDPDYAPAYNGLADGYFKCGQLDLARQAAQKALDLDNTDPANHITMGSILIRQDPRRALEHFLKAATYSIQRSDLLLNLANGFARLEQFEHADTCYQAALRKNPSDGLICYNYGMCLVQQGKPDPAAAMLQKSIALNNRFPLAHYHLGQLYAQQGRTRQALDSFESALKLVPKDAELLFDIGQACDKCKNYSDAETAYRGSLSIRPDDVDTRMALAQCLEAQGRCDEAGDEYRAILEHRNDCPPAVDALTRLQKQSNPPTP